MYTHVELQCCTHETNIVCQLYLNSKKKVIQPLANEPNKEEKKIS